MINTTNAIATGIHIGDNTHIQDQCITLHSFNTIKAIVNAPQNPIPPLFDGLLFLLVITFSSLSLRKMGTSLLYNYLR